jgi:23S rRNA pseudouridine2605 synthase
MRNTPKKKNNTFSLPFSKPKADDKKETKRKPGLKTRPFDKDNGGSNEKSTRDTKKPWGNKSGASENENYKTRSTSAKRPGKEEFDEVKRASWQKEKKPFAKSGDEGKKFVSLEKSKDGIGAAPWKKEKNSFAKSGNERKKFVPREKNKEKDTEQEEVDSYEKKPEKNWPAKKDNRSSGPGMRVSKSQLRGEKYRNSIDRDKKSFSSYKTRSPKNEQHDDIGESGDLPRLNKYISNAGICSRREADDLIKAGAVTINGKVVTDLGTRVKATDIVSYGGQSIRKERPVYILLNKPRNYITTSDDPQERKTVLELIKGACRERVYPVGRLDRNTTGLLILTNDGELTKILTHPRYEKKKIYHVSLDKPLRKEDLETVAAGVELADGPIKVDEISYVTGEPKTEIGIEIHSGKNRIVRRIFESIGYEVKKLDRVFFAGITKKDLPRGRWRFLNEREVAMLKSR